MSHRRKQKDARKGLMAGRKRKQALSRSRAGLPDLDTSPDNLNLSHKQSESQYYQYRCQECGKAMSLSQVGHIENLEGVDFAWCPDCKDKREDGNVETQEPKGQEKKSREGSTPETD